MRARVLHAVLFVAAAASPAGVAAPPEVGNVRFSAPATLTWDAVPGAAGYNVYRGTRGDAGDLRCLAYAVEGTSFADALVAPLLTYVVTAWDGEAEGPLGGGRAPLVACADTDGDGAHDAANNCPAVFNPAQADQDVNGAGDLCDPATYAFEFDLPGARPAGMTQRGAANATFTVRDSGGDLAAAYDTNLGAYDGFDRLTLRRAFQDQTVYVETRDLPGEYFDLFLRNEGSHAENAGTSLLFRITSNGSLLLYQRAGNEYALLQSASVAGFEQLRLRLAKLQGSASRLHVDAWDGAAYAPDAAVFEIADDHRLFGRGLGLTDIGAGRRPLLRLTARGGAAEPALTLDRAFEALTDWKLFQRGPAGTADVPVPVSYRAAAPARLELALVFSADGGIVPGFDYADHATPLPASADGAYDAVLPAVPAGGNYDVHARLVDAGSGTVLAQDTVSQVAVGDVFLAAGQSNMSGYPGTLAGAEAPADAVHLFGNDYRWKRGAEPMDDGFEQVDRVSGEAPQASLMLRFGKDLAAALGVPVAIVPAPLGGTNLHTQWQRRADDPAHRGTLYGSAIHRVRAQGYAHPIAGVIWYQGESDAGRGRDAYLADLRRLVADFRADLGAPDLFFGNCQLATYLFSDLDTWLPIQEAQRLQGLDPRAAVIALVDQPLADTIHLTVDGYRTAGARLARAVLEGAYGLPQVQGPRLVRVELDAGRSAVRVVFDKDVTGGAPVLFRVTDNGVPVTITAQVTSGTTVTLQLQRQVSAAGARVSYGYGRSPTSPWVRAADGSGPAPAFWSVPVQ